MYHVISPGKSLIIDLAKDKVDDLLRENFVSRNPDCICCEIVPDRFEDAFQVVRRHKIPPSIKAHSLQPLSILGDIRNLFEKDFPTLFGLLQEKLLFTVEPD